MVLRSHFASSLLFQILLFKCSAILTCYCKPWFGVMKESIRYVHSLSHFLVSSALAMQFSHLLCFAASCDLLQYQKFVQTIVCLLQKPQQANKGKRRHMQYKDTHSRLILLMLNHGLMLHLKQAIESF